jgi:hypothetical protein
MSIRDILQTTKVLNQLKAKQRLKENLKARLNKHLQTLIIGVLDILEKEIGVLWGFNEESPTKEQQEFLVVWNSLRTKLLDFGHNQKNRVFNEIDKYEISQSETQPNPNKNSETQDYDF